MVRAQHRLQISKSLNNQCANHIAPIGLICSVSLHERKRDAYARTSLHSTDTRIGITLAEHIDLKYAQKREAKSKKKSYKTKSTKKTTYK